MSAMTIHQPPIVDADGNITVHGRSSLALPIKRYTDRSLETQVDISAETIFLEVDGVGRFRLEPDPNDDLGLLLTIADLEAAGLLVTPGSYPAYVLRDETGAYPIVRMQGIFIVTGWEGSPGDGFGGSSFSGAEWFGGSVAIVPQVDNTVVALVYQGPAGPAGDQFTLPKTLNVSPYQLTALDCAMVLVWPHPETLIIQAPDGLGAGFRCEVLTVGSGYVRIEAAGTASVSAPGGMLETATAFGCLVLRPIALDQYVVSGGDTVPGTILDFTDPINSALSGG